MLEVRQTSSVDIPGREEIDQAIDQALAERGEDLLSRIKSAWTGFRNPTGRSLRGWTLEISGPLSIAVVNEVPYTGFVHRPGSKENLVLLGVGEAVDDVAKRVEEELADAVEGEF